MKLTLKLAYLFFEDCSRHEFLGTARTPYDPKRISWLLLAVYTSVHESIPVIRNTPTKICCRCRPLVTAYWYTENFWNAGDILLEICAKVVTSARQNTGLSSKVLSTFPQSYLCVVAYFEIFPMSIDTWRFQEGLFHRCHILVMLSYATSTTTWRRNCPCVAAWFCDCILFTHELVSWRHYVWEW